MCARMASDTRMVYWQVTVQDGLVGRPRMGPELCMASYLLDLAWRRLAIGEC